MQNYSVNIISTICLLSLYTYFFPAKEKGYVQEEKVDPIVQWAQQNLPQTGVLTKGRGGFIYLKVDDNYIDQLFPKLSNTNYQKPPFFRRPDSPGAHISVFYVNESRIIDKITEIGQTFPFTITEVTSVPPKTHEYIILEVESPELEKLRVKYGFEHLLKGHKFHITIAKRRIMPHERHKMHSPEH